MHFLSSEGGGKERDVILVTPAPRPLASAAAAAAAAASPPHADRGRVGGREGG